MAQWLSEAAPGYCLFVFRRKKTIFADLKNFYSNHIMKKILLFAALFFSAAAMYGQNQLPNDPDVRKGRLDNGLTYYIKHNDKPAQRAEFYLATNVGAIQETPDQDGLAHFLEHMCFNGTKNLPGKTMLDYLQKIGAEFGRNINAATGVEQTTYMLNNIPVIREGIVDTCLLIMHDYSHYVTCDPAEIDAERGVILEEKRTRSNADWRMHEKSLPYYYGDSKYATCTLIGSEENLKTFKPESLLNFYHTWYRPDLQAVIVVGDIDVDQIEAKIKALFSDIPAQENPKQKEVYKIPSNTEPLVGVITDPEATATTLTVMWKSDPMPEELNSTDLGFTMKFIEDLIYYVMAERFNDITSSPDAPFLNASFGVGNLCETCDVAMGSISCKNGEGISAFKAFMTEIEKMKRYGFTDDEVDRAKENILSYYEQQAEGADSRKNAEFVQSYINNFFDNYPYMVPETEYELAKAIGAQINAGVVNQVASQLITKENMVILYKAPEKEGLTHPADTDFITVLGEVENSEIQANETQNYNVPLLDASLLKGSPVKKTEETIYGATKWTLKNGLKVIVLPTDYEKDNVMMQLYMDGGRSLIETEDLPSFEDNIFGLFMQNTGIAGFSGKDLPKILAGKTVSVSPFISGLSHGISASSSPKDLETAFQLMYLTFMEPRFDEDEFNAGISQITAILPNIQNQPDFKLQQEMTKVLYNDNPRRITISEDVVAKASLSTIERVYRQLYDNIAGATLVIVGNVDMDTLKPLVEKYAGSLPKGKKAHQWIDRDEDIVKGKIEDHFTVKMETPKTTVFQLYSSYVPYSIHRSVMMNAAQYIMDMIYVATLREEEGGTYGAGVSFDIQNKPEERALIQVYFDTNPDAADKLRKSAVDGIYKLMNEGPTDEQLAMTIENFKKNIPESRIRNSYWMSNIKYFEEYGTDYDKAYEEAISDINAENIKAAVRDIVSQENFIEVMMSPAE